MVGAAKYMDKWFLDPILGFTDSFRYLHPDEVTYSWWSYRFKAAQEKGYERIDKHPKSTRYGRQNPISEQWNSEEQLCLWRANWADAVNKMLALNQINAAIDHRSFAAQGITEQPTIHEGYIAQNMEKKGMIADRCEINRQIRADNQMLRELKTQVSKLAQAVKHSIPVIAETMETIRNHMIFTQYHLLHNEMQKK